VPLHSELALVNTKSLFYFESFLQCAATNQRYFETFLQCAAINQSKTAGSLESVKRLKKTANIKEWYSVGSSQLAIFSWQFSVNQFKQLTFKLRSLLNQ